MKTYIVTFGLIFAATGWADSAKDDFEAKEQAARDQALQQTLELMRDKSKREQGLLGDKAKAVDGNVNRMTGGDSGLNDEVYSLAADLFETLYKEANGDTVKMQELLNKYLSNPEMFAAKFSPGQRAKLKSLSERMPASTPRN